MNTIPPAGPLADPAARILALPLKALGTGASDLTPFSNGMPAGSSLVSPHNLVIGATVCSAPLLRDAVQRVARDLRHDAILVRTGLFPETLDPVTVDVALTGGDGVALNAMAFYRSVDGSLWLVPTDNIPAWIELDATGLRLVTHPPFVTADERVDGLCRAAAEIVRIATKGRMR